jgi:hypothetical protein
MKNLLNRESRKAGKEIPGSFPGPEGSCFHDSISGRLELARQCDKQGQKAKAAMIRSGLADLIMKASTI